MQVDRAVVGFLHDSWAFVRNLHTATSPDARWGTVQLVLSFAFFSFGVFLTLFTVYLTPDGGTLAVLALAILFALGGFAAFAWAIGLGYYFWRRQDAPPLLVVTEKEVRYDATKSRIVNGKIVLANDKYEVVISEKQAPNAKNG